MTSPKKGTGDASRINVRWCALLLELGNQHLSRASASGNLIAARNLIAIEAKDKKANG
jgi:hypothetical protein